MPVCGKFVPYVHNTEWRVHGRFYGLDLKTCHKYTRFVNGGKKTAAGSEAKGKEPGFTCSLLDNSDQGKDAGILFRLNYSIHQHIAIECDTSS